jgi:putative DNA primase/helicase
MLPVSDLSRALEALQCIPSDLPRNEWVRVLMAAHAAGVPEEEAEAWSAQAGSFNARDFRDTWRSIKPGGGIGAGTLFKLAAEHGYGKRRTLTLAHTRSGPLRTAQEPRTDPRQGEDPSTVWNRCIAAPADHPYIVAKAGLPDGLRVVPAGDPLRIAGESMAGALVVPVQRRDGSISSLQFITPPEVAARLKADRKPSKLNLPGARMDGAWLVGSITSTLFLCEGIGQAWAVWKATGSGALVCFGWSRVRPVATELREVYPTARLVLVPDVGKEAEAEAIARELRADVAAMPEGWQPNADVNDYAKQEGHDALEVLLSHAKAPDAEPLPFSLVPIADLATATPTPPVFVWDGLVPSGHVTLFAAHGGTGKSYLALMLAVAVAMGLPLFGIPTRRGIVAFYSGEDGAHVLRDRLARVCFGLGVAVERLEGRLFILDATDEDPTLFTEVTTAGRREGATTKSYSSLRDFAAEKGVSFLVVDNASDAFDASEIDRARVRGFMRSGTHRKRARRRGAAAGARGQGHEPKGTGRYGGLLRFDRLE